MSPAALDPRTPVLVGASQVLNRAPQLDEVVDAIALMEQAVVEAAADAGSSALLADLDTIAVMQGRWRWPDPARLVAARVGASGARTVFAMASGTSPQDLVIEACRRVRAGAANAVAICGGEWTEGRRRLRRASRRLPVTVQEDQAPDEHFGRNRTWESPEESERGFTEPLLVYALFESAIAAARGESWDEARCRAATITQRLNRVAVSNEHAWSRQRVTIEQLREPTAANRMVVYPYTKWMVANPNVDMAFALLVCSAEEAGRRGISRDRWVFPASAAVCDDRCWFSELGSYSESPHHRLTARAALELASVDAADIAYLDLYACFPSVVQLEADALGIDPLEREITVTGGLPFLGGPLASYMGHAIATMVDLLRHDSTELGLCVGNGGYLNKLASAVYAAKPPNGGFRVRDVSERARAAPHRRRSVAAAGDVAVEASTVVFDHDGPAQAHVSMLAPSGERHLGSSRDSGLMHALLDDHHVGDRASVSVEGVVHLHD